MFLIDLLLVVFKDVASLAKLFFVLFFPNKCIKLYFRLSACAHLLHLSQVQPRCLRMVGFSSVG